MAAKVPADTMRVAGNIVADATALTTGVALVVARRCAHDRGVSVVKAFSSVPGGVASTST